MADPTKECDYCESTEVVDCDDCDGSGMDDDGDCCDACAGVGEVECSWCGA